jgi:hypothetical protein
MPSPIQIIRPSKPLFTLLVQDNETGQKFIASYNDSAILTTEREDLVLYTANLIHHYGRAFTYTISTVTEMPISETNQAMIDILNRAKDTAKV